MTHQETLPCPDEILAAIPWYPSELDDSTRGEVESHAAQCTACRDEIAFVHEGTTLEVDLENRDRVYAKLLERIEKHEGATPRVMPLQAAERRDRELRMSWPLALAAGLALAVLSGGLGAVGSDWFQAVPSAVNESYEVAGASETTAAAVELPALEVVFRADANAEAIHAALRAVGGQIVSGPTQLGVYRVQLAADADLAAAAQTLRGEELGVATFAEPSLR